MPSGDWIETTQIHHDATTTRVVFTKLDAPRVGALLVWPDHRVALVTRHGHVGVVVSVSDSAPARVVHCSSGNFRMTGCALRETSSLLFDRAGAIVVAPIDSA
jgi:hypothetical protein